jgi:hypothetical protein
VNASLLQTPEDYDRKDCKSARSHSYGSDPDTVDQRVWTYQPYTTDGTSDEGELY